MTTIDNTNNTKQYRRSANIQIIKPKTQDIENKYNAITQLEKWRLAEYLKLSNLSSQEKSVRVKKLEEEYNDMLACIECGDYSITSKATPDFSRLSLQH